MVVSQADVWWAELLAPTGSGPGFRRPVLVVQGNPVNRSRISTILCVPLTSNLRRAAAHGNVQLDTRHTGLDRESVANVSQLVPVDRNLLVERVGQLPTAQFELVMSGIDILLDRQVW